MVLLFWCRLTQVVLEKRLLNECSSVVVGSCACVPIPLFFVVSVMLVHSLSVRIIHLVSPGQSPGGGSIKWFY